MENLQILKFCPWVTEKYNVKEYFEKYNNGLDEINGMSPHNKEFDIDKKLREFFQTPDDLDGYLLSRRSTPGLSFSVTASSVELTENVRPKSGPPSISSVDQQNISLMRSKSVDDIEDSNKNNDIDDEGTDYFSVPKMREACNIDLLNVDDELAPRDLCETGPIGDSGRVTNWYAGAFMDGVIPDGGPEKLATLACQARELYKRETVRDYTRLRHRLLKYASTVRMVMKKENSPENVPLQENMSKACLRDTIFNIRVQRPYHKKSYQKKGLNRYPKHSQEMFMLGSQKLTELRDAIVCINDIYVHEDMSENPDITRSYSQPSTQSLFPSGFFYVNGVFYSDMRNPCAVDNSEPLKAWAKRYPTIAEMTTKKMEETTLNDLELRLGYPYVYQHLGNCEHLITFTDIRLHHRTDIQDPSRYPLSRGNPIKLSVSCYACGLHMANWILKDCPQLPVPYAHLCDECLKLFCYDDEGKKRTSIKVYPFTDEFSAQREKERRELAARNFEITIGKPSGDQSLLTIEPYVEQSAEK